MNELKHFYCTFQLKGLHDPDEDGPNIGRFSGYASTFGNIDRTDDVIEKGAFTESLEDLRSRDRQIRMLSQHDRFELIGGFPPGMAREDDRGLFVEGNINLDTIKGAESFSLMKQGVLTDLSIGFIPVESERIDGINHITKIELFEISLVTEPANIEARITAIKAIVPFQDLPLADIGMAWDSEAAIVRVKEFTESEDVPPDTYRNGFLWHDRSEAQEFGSYKLLIATVIDGQMVAVPRGVFAAAAAMQGARGGVFIPEQDRPGVIRNIERYYEKMGRESPFEKGFSPDELKGLGRGDLVGFLRSSPLLSKNGAEFVASRIHTRSVDQANDNQADGLRTLRNTLISLRNEGRRHA